MKKKGKGEGITILDFKLYYKAVVIKTVWYCHKNRHIDNWKRIENAGMNSSLYGQLVLEKKGKNIQVKKTVSSINGVGKIGQQMQKERNWITFLHHTQK